MSSNNITSNSIPNAVDSVLSSPASAERAPNAENSANSLPEELIKLIFSLATDSLSLKEYFKLGHTSKQFRRISRDSTLIIHIAAKHFNFNKAELTEEQKSRLTHRIFDFIRVPNMQSPEGIDKTVIPQMMLGDYSTLEKEEKKKLFITIVKYDARLCYDEFKKRVGFESNNIFTINEAVNVSSSSRSRNITFPLKEAVDSRRLWMLSQLVSEKSTDILYGDYGFSALADAIDREYSEEIGVFLKSKHCTPSIVSIALCERFGWGRRSLNPTNNFLSHGELEFVNTPQTEKDRTPYMVAAHGNSPSLLEQLLEKQPPNFNLINEWNELDVLGWAVFGNRVQNVKNLLAYEIKHNSECMANMVTKYTKDLPYPGYRKNTSHFSKYSSIIQERNLRHAVRHALKYNQPKAREILALLLDHQLGTDNIKAVSKGITPEVIVNAVVKASEFGRNEVIRALMCIDINLGLSREIDACFKPETLKKIIFSGGESDTLGIDIFTTAVSNLHDKKVTEILKIHKKAYEYREVKQEIISEKNFDFILEMALHKGGFLNSRSINKVSALNILVALLNHELGELCAHHLGLTTENVTSRLGNAFLLATAFGHTSLVKALVTKANINIDNSYKVQVPDGEEGMNALMYAAQKGYVDIVRFLLSKGARVNFGNAKGNTALHLCAEKNHPEICKLLLEQKDISIYSRNKRGQTPLICAAWNNAYLVVRYILQKDSSGINLTTRYSTDTSTALLAAAPGRLQAVQELLKYPQLNVTLSDYHGNVAYFVAKSHANNCPTYLEIDKKRKEQYEEIAQLLWDRGGGTNTVYSATVRAPLAALFNSFRN